MSGIPLLEAVKGFDDGSYAILYAPQFCRMAIFDGVSFKDEENNNINVADVYEARVFNADRELRWHEGTVQIITDAELRDEENFAGTITQKYLLWGEVSPAKDSRKANWTEFAAARIGKFYVPIKLEAGQNYAQFTVCEYLKEFADGNVSVSDERLTGIVPYEPGIKGGTKNAD